MRARVGHRLDRQLGPHCVGGISQVRAPYRLDPPPQEPDSTQNRATIVPRLLRLRVSLVASLQFHLVIPRAFIVVLSLFIFFSTSKVGWAWNSATLYSPTQPIELFYLYFTNTNHYYIFLVFFFFLCLLNCYFILYIFSLKEPEVDEAFFGAFKSL